MTHKDAILSILKEAGITKTELARRCGYASGMTAIDPRLRGDIQLSILRRFADALGYKVVLVPLESDKPEYVLDEDIPCSQKCGHNQGGRRGPVRKHPEKKKSPALKSWTTEELLRRFGMEEV